MIKNDRQLEYTRRRLRELEENLEEVRSRYSSNKKQVGLLSQGFIEHIAQLKGEVEEYERMKKGPLPRVLRAHDAGEISRQLVRLRIARGLTQAELAERIGCKQADISRLEREDYQGYTISQLKKVAAGLNAELGLSLVPSGRLSRERGSNFAHN